MEQYVASASRSSSVGQALFSVLFYGFGILVVYRYYETGLRVVCILSFFLLDWFQNRLFSCLKDEYYLILINFLELDYTKSTFLPPLLSRGTSNRSETFTKFVLIKKTSVFESAFSRLAFLFVPEEI